MTDYIEREAFKAEIRRLSTHYLNEWDTLGVLAAADRIPAADVRPVVRAHWYWDKDGMDWGIGAWRCSACKTMSPMWWNCDKGSPRNKSGHYYCPNCGADMREES